MDVSCVHKELNNRALHRILHPNPLKFVYWIFIRPCCTTKPYFSIHVPSMDAIGKNYCPPYGERSPVSADGRFSNVPLLFFFIFFILSTGRCATRKRT